MSVLSGKDVSKYCTSFKKVNPNGVDITPKEVRKIPPNVAIYLHGEERGYLDLATSKPKTTVTDAGKVLLRPDSKGFYHLFKGDLYELRFPKVSVPADCTGFAFPRSTINRLGIIKLESAVFDSGYSGEFTQSIFTPLDARIHKDEALVQLVFIRNESAAKELYRGRYQNEKSRRSS